MATTDVSALCIPRFHDVLGDVFARGHTHCWLHGGRGSTKSSFISLCIVLLVVNFPFANAVVVRRFSNTPRGSVYQQILWAIGELGLDSYFRARLSPMEISYVPTGQKIIFRGADDPLKLKGVKFPTGYAAVVWLEELDQFDGIEAVRSILNSLRRGDDDFWCFYSYNPPRTMWSWVNQEHTANKMGPEDIGRIVLESLTYADEPGEEPYFHDELIWCDDTPDGKMQMNTYRCDLGIRAKPARKGRMRKLSYEWLANLREVVIDSERCPLTFAEFVNKEYLRDRDGNWLDEIPDGQDHSIDAIRYAMMDDVLRG